MSGDFHDKIALVTGASRGIGRAIARELAGRGARVAVHYNSDPGAAEKTITELAGEGHRVFRADLTDATAIATMVAEVIDVMGRVDVLINNAGIFEYHQVAEIGYDEWQEAWQRTLQINLFGPANLIHCIVPHMISNGGGRIVNISSRGAFRGEPKAPAYGASKAGLNAMGQSLAKALAPHKIYIATVAPGFVETEMARPALAARTEEEIKREIPFGRVARSEEVAVTTAFLASSGTEYLTGCIVDVNGASYLRS